mmetsp:Transcript_43758/g.132510  ORF Transcript_43758/g.132510 Transcript_43758/m.132510 type:complete len:213 (+) Transcript_43758:323-961(+)
MPSVSNHWYFHLAVMLRDRLKIWKSSVNVAPTKAAIRIFHKRWKSANFSNCRLSFNVSMRPDRASKTQEKIAPFNSDTGNKQSNTKAMESEWLCLKDSTASRMKSKTIYKKLNTWIFRRTWMSKYGRVMPQPSEATSTSMYENVDFTTVSKIAKTNKNLPRTPLWFQSLKNVNHKMHSSNPRKITTAMQFWIANSSRHHRIDSTIHASASPT